MKQRGFILPSFLLSPTGIMAAVIVVLSLSNALFYKLWQGKVDDYAQLQAQVSMERDQAKFDAQQAKERADRVTADVSLAWANALDHLRKHPVIRVLRTTDHLPHQDANATGGSDAALKPPPSDTGAITPAECEIYLNRGLEDSLNYEWLQHWVRTEQEALK